MGWGYTSAFSRRHPWKGGEWEGALQFEWGGGGGGGGVKVPSASVTNEAATHATAVH